MAETDNHSLHDIRRGQDFPGLPASASTTQCDNEGRAVRRRLKQLSIQLYTRPCYAALSSGPLPTDFHYGDFSAAYNSRYRESEVVYNWIPSFSGQRFRYLIWIMLWFVVGLHWLISTSSHLQPGSVLRSVVPAAFCSCLAAVTMQVVAAEIRRESYHFRSKTSSKVSQARRLWHYRWLVVYVMAPLLSVPLWSTRFSSEPQWFIWFRPEADLLTFSSWGDAIGNFQASVPNVQGTLHWLGEVGEAEHAWEDWRLLVNKSELTNASHRYPGVPDVLRFDRNAGNRGYVYGWEDAIEGEVLAMPTFVTDNFDAGTVSVNIRALIELLAPSFECVQLDKRDPWTLNETVELNFENCNAIIKMQKETLSKQAQVKLEQDYEMEIERTHKAAEAQPGRAAALRLRGRVDDLRQRLMILREDEEPYVIKPQWIRTSYGRFAGGRKCESSFFFMGDNQSIRRSNETHIAKEELSGVYCEPRFQTRFVTAEILLRKSIFRTGHTLSTSFRPRFLTESAFHLTDGETTGFWGAVIDFLTVEGGIGVASTWLALEGEDATKLSQAVAERLPSTVCWRDNWTQQLLRYGLQDALNDAKYDLAAVALGTKIAAAWITAHFSETADLTFGNAVSDSSGSIAKAPGLRKLKGDMRATKLITGNFASSIWFKTPVLLLACACSYVAYSANKFSDDRPSELPWSIETIAAKACLLIQSRLRPAFGSTNHSPDEIRGIPGLALGHWESEEGNTTCAWRLDTQCNNVIIDQQTLGKEEYRSTTLWTRHDPVSLPIAAKPWVNLIKFIVFSIPISIVLSVKGTIKPGMIDLERLPAVLSTDLPLAFGWGGTLLLMILPQVLAFVVIGWWNNLDNFYSARQPWAGLMVPSLAHLTLTLDYVDCKWRLWKALTNRHYAIALLSIGWALSLILPVLTASILRLDAGSRQNGVIQGVRTNTWDKNYIPLPESTLQPPIPISAVNALIKPPAEINGVVMNYALASLEFHPQLNRSSLSARSHWKAETTSLRGHLACSQLSALLYYGQAESIPGLQQPGRIEIDLPENMTFMNGETSLHIESCGGSERHVGPQIPPGQAPRGEKLWCSRWALEEVSTEPNSPPIPMWIVTLVIAELDSWHAAFGPLVKPGITTLALLCEPEAYFGTGSVKLVPEVVEGNGSTRVVGQDYKPDFEQTIDGRIAQEFSRLLNITVHPQPKTAEELPIDIPTPMIQATSFVGDFMGYLLYRTSLLLNKYSGSDPVEQLASHVYATIFSAYVSESNWLKRNKVSDVEVVQFEWTEQIRVRQFVLSVTLLVGAFFTVSACYLAWIKKAYMFPIAPELLENSLFFLYQSQIVDMLEDHIEHPEKLRIQAIHRRIEVLGHKYAFGRYKESSKHYEQFGVDLAGELGIEESSTQEDETQRPTERYRDDESESESSSGGSSSDEETSSDTRRRSKPLREHESGQQSDEEVSEDSEQGSDAGQGAGSDQEEREDSEHFSDNDPNVLLDVEEAESDRERDDIHKKDNIKITGNRPPPSQRRQWTAADFPSIKHLPELNSKPVSVMHGQQMYNPADFPTVRHLPDPQDFDGQDNSSNDGSGTADPVTERVDKPQVSLHSNDNVPPSFAKIAASPDHIALCDVTRASSSHGTKRKDIFNGSRARVAQAGRSQGLSSQEVSNSVEDLELDELPAFDFEQIVQSWEEERGYQQFDADDYV